jgi:hypothetical protein
MSLGGVSATIVTGGAQASASGADLAKTIVGIGVCTAGPAAQLLHPSGAAAMRSALGAGPLAEAQALLWAVPGAPAPYALPVTPTTPGGVAAASTQVGNGAGTVTPSCAPHVPIKVKCFLGGALGTAKFQFSLDGGVTYSAPVLSTSSSFVYPVPGTFSTLTFAAATYVATKVLDVGTDGVVTAGSGWVGSVTQVSSPIDNYDVVATTQTGGALGTCVLAVSLDGGRTQFGPALLVPAGGVVVVPGTGLVLTCANSFTRGDTYSFPASAPAPTTNDITAAITAMLADPTAPAACVFDLGALPSSAAAAFTLVAAMETALETAFAAGKDWLMAMTCPLAGDNIVLTGTTQVDTADTRAVVKTARVGTTAPRVSVFYGTDNVQSGIGSYQVRRPRSTIFAARIAAKLPVEPNGSTVATRDAPLAVAKIGDDDLYASVSLYDAQLNGFQSVPGYNGAYLTIGRGFYAWQNLTTDAVEVDADSFRAINAILAAFRPICATLVGKRYPLNANGTIAAKTIAGLNTMLDTAIKKCAGIGPGAAFGGVPQVSDATSYVNPATNLGALGDKVVKVIASILPEGFSSAVDIELHFLGA